VLLAGFVPPRRFAAKSFDDYRPDPRHPSQGAAAEALRQEAAALRRANSGWAERLRGWLRGVPRGGGVYLDGGFGVGKTHLLAALWHAAPEPRAYLSFDELVYTLGLFGVEGTRRIFAGVRLVAVDEWELDDPGNLKLALAFLRGALADGTRVATTSNTVPDELGRGRFDQKSFAAEIEELSAAFRVIHIEGEDFRHRRFEADPGMELFADPDALATLAPAGDRPLLRTSGEELQGALASVHPIRFDGLVNAIGGVAVEGLAPFARLPEALRWVHFIDKLYDAALPFAASSSIPLGALFTPEMVHGPFGKKVQRCLSRMEELLAEGAPSEAAEAQQPADPLR
jgi:cell division protein ZapE